MDTATPRPATRPQLTWLRGELADWQRAGLIDAEQAGVIAGRYREVPDRERHFSLGRLLLGLGALFVGIGLIWLVAANLDALSPLVRFVVVAALCLGFLVTAETVGARFPTAARGAVRLLAALAFGATIFQAAQSLQVPSYSPALVGLWSAGTLLHAYVFRAFPPLLVGVATGVVWWCWQPIWEAASGLGAVVALGSAAVVAVSLAVVHDRGLVAFAQVWRTVGCALALVALFVAAAPFTTTDDFAWTAWLVGGLVVAGLAAAVSVARAAGTARLEPLVAVAVLGVSVLLVWWDTGADTSEVGLADWAHAGVSVAVYVAAAVGVAALGTLRDSVWLTVIAMIALVVFTTFQSFAVFAAIIQGAWLFVVLGLVFLATGLLFDRARRRLADTLETEGAPA